MAQESIQIAFRTVDPRGISKSAWMNDVTAIITTMDNLPLLKRQIDILSSQVGHIIVVNNGSKDGTKEWLDSNQRPDVSIIHKENKGAGPGRNAGLNLWNETTPYVLMVDGGILPPHNSIVTLLDFLERHPEVQVISPEIASCYTTKEEEATRRMSGYIPDNSVFSQTAISGTAFALCRSEAWRDGIRFAEDGPFGEPGWGVDDNDMACRWNDAGILHKDFTFAQTGIKLYRRASGSFQRLFEETGIYPNQYGSVYEKRNVLTFQRWRKYFDGIYFAYGAIEYSFVFQGIEFPELAYAIKEIHDFYLKKEKPVSHEIIVDYYRAKKPATIRFLKDFSLRWPWGNVTVNCDTGEIIRRNEDNENIWTGDIQFLHNILPRGKHIINVTGKAIERLLKRPEL